jgi:hypothetical protein
MKSSSFIFAVVLCSGLYGCSKEKPCTTVTEHTNNGHLIDVSPIQQTAAEFLDSLNKYPMLQAYKYRSEGSNKRIDCHVYYQGVRMFFSTYGLLKTSNGDISPVGNNVTDFNLNINFTPDISFSDAIVLAKNNLDFGNACTSYALGVADNNSIKGLPGNDYRLVWRVGPENSDAFVYVDAHTGEIITVYSGIFD